MSSGTLEWIFCPYCKEGHGCVNHGSYLECTRQGKTFTLAQSLEAIKNR